MANEKRLIDADALVANFRKTKMDEVFPEWKELGAVAKTAVIRLTTKYRAIVLSAPIVDAVEVVHGMWIPAYPTGSFLVRCSACKTLTSHEMCWNYCPNCGAKMDCDGNA